MEGRGRGKERKVKGKRDVRESLGGKGGRREKGREKGRGGKMYGGQAPQMFFLRTAPGREHLSYKQSSILNHSECSSQ